MFLNVTKILQCFINIFPRPWEIKSQGKGWISVIWEWDFAFISIKFLCFVNYQWSIIVEKAVKKLSELHKLCAKYFAIFWWFWFLINRPFMILIYKKCHLFVFFVEIGMYILTPRARTSRFTSSFLSFSTLADSTATLRASNCLDVSPLNNPFVYTPAMPVINYRSQSQSSTT